MGTTSLGIVYPDPSATPKRQDLEDLATSADAAIADTNTALAALGVWTTYTPTLSQWTLGNGTLAGSYTRIGTTILFRIKLTVGSTTTFTGGPVFTLPTIAAAAGIVGGSAQLVDTSASAYYGAFAVSANDGSVFLRTDASAAPSASVPFSWAVNDWLLITGMYEAAS